MRYSLLVILIAFAATVHAQDYGDAPASYGLAGAGGVWNTLGMTVSNDTSNPVTPAWTGDNDDGIVGTPLWNSWSSSNQLTVHIEGSGYLYMFVDADDSGTFEQSELYTYFRDTIVTGPADLTFTGIKLHKLGGYSLNGANKVAVRIMFYYGIGTFPQYQPVEMMFMGRVED
ncbi:MAG: hypothetical protein L3J82_02050, partial [Planctomycetes bacterium]|nr:hypothetical protein [Planctomycetota bacterium]